MNRHVIGVDIGGTNLRCGLIDGSGRILERRKCASRIEDGRDAFCERLLAEISILQGYALQRGASVGGVGMGIPGLIGVDGTIHSSINLPALENFNLATCVRERSGLAVVSANDANVAALGEQRFGAGQGYSSCMVITVGTGLGSGLILGDKIWAGKGGFAAEFGHITVDPEGMPCPCGNRGCLEQYVSAGALVRHARKYMTVPSPERLDAAMVAEYAQNGEAGALAAFDQLSYWLGTAFASLINTLNIEAFIVGGGVSASFDLFAPMLRHYTQQRCFAQMYQDVVIEKALLGDDAGLLGGAALAADIC